MAGRAWHDVDVSAGSTSIRGASHIHIGSQKKAEVLVETREDDELLRVSTPPSIRDRKRHEKHDDQFMRIPTPPSMVVGRKDSVDWDMDRLVDSGGEDGDSRLSSPCSLTAGPASTTAFNPASLKNLTWDESFDGSMIVGYEEEEAVAAKAKKNVLYFDSGVRFSELVDSSLHPPQYKDQYTVTGQIRRVKLKREGPPVGKLVSVNGKELALFRFKDRCYAILNKCCHQGGPLFQGDIEDIGKSLNGENCRQGGNSSSISNRQNKRGERNKPYVACPWHGWKFDLHNGTCLSNSDFVQETFPCKIEYGNVHIGFDDFSQDQFSGTSFDF